MKTLKRLMVVCMALTLVCMTAPLGHTQDGTLCPKCGVAATFPKCPPGMLKISQPNCSDVKDVIRPNWSFDFRSGAVDVSPAEDPDLAYALSPAWSSDGALGQSTACPKCGAAFSTDSRIRKLERQP